jgi:predicted DNA-binding transcriptional regulator YafY
MPANKFALLRYRIIDRCIRNRGSKAYPTKDDLRYACEEALYGSDGEHISMSTIDKDIWAMRNEGELGYYAPIKFSKEQGGYYYENPEFTISEVPLNEDDLNAIQAAAETLYQFRDIPLFKQFDSAIEKIFDRMKISTTNSDSRDNEVIQFERIGDYKGSEFLQPLYKACTDRNRVKLSYKKFQGEETKQYQFEPYILKEYKSRWYVIGNDADSGRLKTFSLDRLESVLELDERFAKGTNFNAAAFFQHSLGITVTDDRTETIELEFKADYAPYILTQPLHPSQKILRSENDSLLISLDLIVTVEVINTILSFGKHVKVLKPAHLKDKVKTTLSECLKGYN